MHPENPAEISLKIFALLLRYYIDSRYSGFVSVFRLQISARTLTVNSPRIYLKEFSRNINKKSSIIFFSSNSSNNFPKRFSRKFLRIWYWKSSPRIYLAFLRIFIHRFTQKNFLVKKISWLQKNPCTQMWNFAEVHSCIHKMSLQADNSGKKPPSWSRNSSGFLLEMSARISFEIPLRVYLSSGTPYFFFLLFLQKFRQKLFQ